MHAVSLYEVLIIQHEKTFLVGDEFWLFVQEIHVAE